MHEEKEDPAEKHDTIPNDQKDTEKIDSLWDQYEEFEDKFRSKGSSGGGKKSRDSQSKTSKSARQETIEHSQEKRKEDSKERISKVIKNFPRFGNREQEDKFVNNYSSWTRKAFSGGLTDLDNELTFDYVRSGAKAGGQNVNKVSSAVVCTHLPTNTTVRNEETRDQFRNKQKAISLIKGLLDSHLKDWRDLIKDTQDITKEFILTLSKEND